MAGCYCSSLLAELGAETIRIEPPGGDLVRTYSPNGIMVKDTGLAYLQEGRNKHHVTLNMETAEGREMFKCFVGAADVLIETYPAGKMDAWGLGYEELSKINPRLIMCSITGFGQFGPESGRAQYDYDNVSQARSAVQYCTGEVLPEGKTVKDMPYAVPTKAGPHIAWAVSGTFGAMGILSALYHRDMTGEGQAIDICTPEAYGRLHDYQLMWYAHAGVTAERFGSLDTALWLYGFYPTKDGGVFLGGLRLEMWKAFVDIIGKYDEWKAEEWTTLAPFMKKDWQLKYQAMINPETVEVHERGTDAEIRRVRQERPPRPDHAGRGRDRVALEGDARRELAGPRHVHAGSGPRLRVRHLRPGPVEVHGDAAPHQVGLPPRGLRQRTYLSVLFRLWSGEAQGASGQGDHLKK